MVSLYCDDDDCVITDNDITGGRWVIGPDPATDEEGDVGTAGPAGDQWPHQVRDWEYYTSGKWQSDPLLTVTGNINININIL